MSQQLTRPITDSTGKGKQARVPHWMRTNTDTSTARHYHHSAPPGEDSYPILRDNVECVKEPLVETLIKSSQGPGNEESKLYSTRFHFLGEGPSNNPLNFGKHNPGIGKEAAGEPDTSGVNSSHSTKAFNINSNAPLPNASISAREVERQWTKTELPDINIELPTLPAVESPPLCLRASRTQSLEMGIHLSNADHTKTTIPVTNSADLDPSNRWVKRLKPSPSKFSPQDTMISNPNTRKFQDKTKNYFNSILDCNITRPSSSKKLQDTILSDSNEESLLSNALIKRWLGNRAKNPDWTDGKVEELSDLNASVDINDDDDDDDDDDDGGDLKRKQFPSIGAMAMMGKAMSGFQSYEVQKRGSIIVWNTKRAF